MGKEQDALIAEEAKKGKDHMRKQIQRAKFYLRKLQELGFITVHVTDEADVLGMACPTKVILKPQPNPPGGTKNLRLPDTNLVSRSLMQQYIMEYDDTVVRRLLDMGYVTKVTRLGSKREWLQLTEKGRQIGVHKGKPILFYFDKTVRALGLRIGQKG